MVYIILRYARIAIELELWPSMIKLSAAVPVAGIVSKMLRFFFSSFISMENSQK